MEISTQVDCGSWWREHSVNSSVVRCHYSRASPGLAVSHVDPGTAATRLGLGLALPAITCTASAAVLVILHAKCCKHLMDRRYIVILSLDACPQVFYYL